MTENTPQPPQPSETPEAKINHITVKFEQEGNTLGTTEEYEELTIHAEFQASQEEGPFYVIKTNGWSFDNIQEIQKLLTGMRPHQMRYK